MPDSGQTAETDGSYSWTSFTTKWAAVVTNSRIPLSPADRTALYQLEDWVETLDGEAVLIREIAVDRLTDGGVKRTEATQQVEQLLLKLPL